MVAEKEKFKEHSPTIKAVKKVLLRLTKQDLRNLYFSYNIGPKLSDEASKEFIIDKLLEKVSPEDFLKNKDFLTEMIDQFDQLSSVFVEILSNLDKADLVKICKEVGKDEISQSRNKSEIIEKLVAEVPFSKIWKSKSLQKRLKPTRISSSYLKGLKTDINALIRTVKELEKRHTETANKSSDKIDKRIAQVMGELQSIKHKFEADEEADLENYLNAFYHQSLNTGDTLSAEKLRDINKRILDKLSIDRWAFTRQGLELFLTYYFLGQTKNLHWKPSFETFMEVVRQEIAKIKSIGERAEIPALRRRVCTRMGISEETFDNTLIEAWEKGVVRLDVGAPIGRHDVKYLRTKEGNLFYYVTLMR